MLTEVKRLEKKCKLVQITQKDFCEELHFDTEMSHLKNDIKILLLKKKKQNL